MTKDMKFDGGKTLAAIPFQDFPNAIQELVKVCTFGARKYERSSWKDVANAEVRYEDALARHFLAQYTEDLDPESGLWHKAHLAWNALATLEMALSEAQEGGYGMPYNIADEAYNDKADCDCCVTEPEFSDEIDMDVIMTTFGPYAFVRK